jgi:hypothetical protein
MFFPPPLGEKLKAKFGQKERLNNTNICWSVTVRMVQESKPSGYTSPTVSPLEQNPAWLTPRPLRDRLFISLHDMEGTYSGLTLE